MASRSISPKPHRKSVAPRSFQQQTLPAGINPNPKNPLNYLKRRATKATLSKTPQTPETPQLSPPPPPPQHTSLYPMSDPPPPRPFHSHHKSIVFSKETTQQIMSAAKHEKERYSFSQTDPLANLEHSAGAIFVELSGALRKLQSRSDYEISLYADSVRDVIRNEDGLSVDTHNKLLCQKLLEQQKHLEFLVTKQSSDSKALLLGASTDYKTSAERCFQGTAEEMTAMQRTLAGAISEAEMATERCRLLEERIESRVADRQQAVEKHADAVIKRCEAMVLDAQNAAVAERRASQMMTMEVKRYEQEARSDFEHKLQNHYESMLRVLASENSSTKRNMRRTQEKYDMLENELKTRYETHCADFERRMLEILNEAKRRYETKRLCPVCDLNDEKQGYNSTAHSGTDERQLHLDLASVIRQQQIEKGGGKNYAAPATTAPRGRAFSQYLPHDAGQQQIQKQQLEEYRKAKRAFYEPVRGRTLSPNTSAQETIKRWSDVNARSPRSRSSGELDGVASPSESDDESPSWGGTEPIEFP